MRWWAWLVLAASCAHAPAGVPPAPSPPAVAAPAEGPAVVGAPVWTRTVAEAKAQARLVRRGVLAVFCANWSLPCKQLSKTAFADPAVTAEMSTHFILVPIDLTQAEDAAAAAIAAQHAVAGVPTLIAFDADGRERGRATEAVTGRELLALLRQAAANLPAGPALAGLTEGACDLAVEELLSAEVLRGTPPGRRGGAGAPPGAEVNQGRYLVCSYRVRMGTHRYRFQRTSHVGEPGPGLLTPMTCAEVGEMGAALTEIQNATAGCRDPGRGGPSGLFLEAA